MIEDGKLACYMKDCKYCEESPYENGFCSRVEKGQAMAVGSKSIRLTFDNNILIDTWIPVCIFYDGSEESTKE